MTDSDVIKRLRLLLNNFFGDIDNENKIETQLANAIVDVHLEKFKELYLSELTRREREVREEATINAINNVEKWEKEWSSDKEYSGTFGDWVKKKIVSPEKE